MPASADRPRAPLEDGRPVNRPGRLALSYRAGTHEVFTRRMLERLRSAAHGTGEAASRPLAGLTTRDRDDPAIAFIDAWAAVADVITFYQERIANEGFLRTATEPQSVLELARSVGYELAPALAASAHLAFTVEDAPGAPLRAEVPAGTRVLSIPAEGELPQTFETVESLDARADWNALALHVPPPASTEPPPPSPQAITGASVELWLAGTDARLKPGDALLVGYRDAGGEQRRLITVDRVDVDAAQRSTRVSWSGGALAAQPPVTRAGTDAAPALPDVVVLRQQAGIFGNVATDWTKLPENQRVSFSGTQDPKKLPQDWPNFAVTGTAIDLDGAYPGTAADTWAVLVSAGVRRQFRVQRVLTLGRADFMLTGKVTRLELDAAVDGRDPVDRRTAMVLFQGESLPIATTVPVLPARPPRPDAEPATAEGTASLTLDRLVEGLVPGRPLIVTGDPVASGSGAGVGEVVTLTATSVRDGRTAMHFSPPLRGVYRTASVRIMANVVRATHGETVAEEVLGSGDGRAENQRFTLVHRPLTYLAAPTVTGRESTLEVRVNAVRWQEVPSLFGLGPRSQAFVVRRDRHGRSHVIFGDGATGARLPSGQENVVARYRRGGGQEGNVAANAVTLLQTRPLGIRGVTNPMAAQGGTAPEGAESARRRVPRTVNTLGRVVSLADVEALAESLTAVGKAQVTTVAIGATPLLHVTVGDAAGAPLDAASDAGRALRDAITALGSGLRRVQVDGYGRRVFVLEATLFVREDVLASQVVDAALQALKDAFSFERRAFGQGVSVSEVIAVVQAVAGVVAVDLDRLYDPSSLDGPALVPFIAAQTARVTLAAGGPRVEPGQLLLFDAGRSRLTAVSAGEARA